MADSSIPDHGVAIAAEAERGDSAVVALQDTHALAGAQVPQPNAAVQRRGEQLQSTDVWVELDQAAQTRIKAHSNGFLTKVTIYV